MTVEPTGEIIVDVCSVQTSKCVARKAAPLTTVVVSSTRSQVKVCSPCLEEKVREGAWQIKGAKINIHADIAVYSANNKLVLIVEIKKMPPIEGNAVGWASNVHRNLIAHSAIPFTPYFLLVDPPEHAYLWKHLPFSKIAEGSDLSTIYSIEIAQPFMEQSLAPNYYLSLATLPDSFTWTLNEAEKRNEHAFVHVFAEWLRRLTKTTKVPLPAQEFINGSGLFSVIKEGSVETNVSIPRARFSNAGLQLLRILCDAALATLPTTAKDKNVEHEQRRELALTQLLRTIQLYTSSRSMRLGAPDEYSASQKVEFQIYRFLEHEWSLYGDDKKQIIVEYLKRAIGNSINEVDTGIGLTPTEYRKRERDDTWHWCFKCSNWPREAYVSTLSKPISGELCNECSHKERAGNC